MMVFSDLVHLLNLLLSACLCMDMDSSLVCIIVASSSNNG